MRLRIEELLKDGMSMRDLALEAYKDRQVIEQTKINRISAINTGRVEATIDDIKRIMFVLDCGCEELLDLND